MARRNCLTQLGSCVSVLECLTGWMQQDGSGFKSWETNRSVMEPGVRNNEINKSVFLPLSRVKLIYETGPALNSDK